MRWSPPYVQRTVQPLTVLVPVFCTFSSTWKLPGHELVMVYVTWHGDDDGRGDGDVEGDRDGDTDGDAEDGPLVGPVLPTGMRYGVRNACLVVLTVTQSSLR